MTLHNEFIPINENNGDDNLINQDISNEELNGESEENFVQFGYEALPQDDDDVQEENNEFYDSFQQVIFSSTKIFLFLKNFLICIINEQEEDNLQQKVLQIHTTEQEKIPDGKIYILFKLVCFN